MAVISPETRDSGEQLSHLLPPVGSNNIKAQVSPRKEFVYISVALDFSSATQGRAPDLLTLTENGACIHKSTKKYLLTRAGALPQPGYTPSTEGTGKYAHLPVSLSQECNYILSHLLPKGPASS